MAINEKVKLVDKQELNHDVFKFSILSEKMAKEAVPGQFLEIKVSETLDPFLRRPISIYNVDKQKGILEFIFMVKGKGTELLSKREIGEYIDIIGPLGGNGFNIKEYKNVAIIGGGIGIFPLYELAKNIKSSAKVNMYIGFRNKEFVVLEQEFKSVSHKFTLTTDDGSYAQDGFAINYLKQDYQKEKFDCIYACGPLPMLKAVQEFALQNNIPCQISLEEKMGCGIGTCMGCAVKLAGQDKYSRVCKEGPVFYADEVEI